MPDRDWLAGWNPRYARVLAETETPDVRAGLVDTNGDGYELWFGLDVRNPEGAWTFGLDWDDVGGHQPVGPVEMHPDVVFAWGTAAAGSRHDIEFAGQTFSVRVGQNGWWLLATKWAP